MFGTGIVGSQLLVLWRYLLSRQFILVPSAVMLRRGKTRLTRLVQLYLAVLDILISAQTGEVHASELGLRGLIAALHRAFKVTQSLLSERPSMITAG